MLRHLISGFRDLRHLDFLTKENKNASTSNIPCVLARTFGEHCPSLRTIRFNVDSFHVQYSPGKWVSFQDTCQLHKEILQLCMETLPVLDACTGDLSTLTNASSLATSLQDLREVMAALRAATSRWVAAARYKDLRAPESDADWSSSISLAYGTCSRVLKRLQGMEGTRAMHSTNVANADRP